MRWDFEHGELAEAESRAAVVVEGMYSSPLSAPGSIETHTCLASFDADGHLTVWTGVHMVFMYRKALADALGLDWKRITVVQPPIGGIGRGHGGGSVRRPHRRGAGADPEQLVLQLRIARRRGAGQ